MHRPIFSCVIPVKGERPFFKEALASLEAQGIEDDLEIIIQDGDVEPDAGQSDALNKGFAKAKGEWLFWLNADDVMLPGALEKVKGLIGRVEHVERVDQNSQLTTYNSKLNWIAGNQLLIDDNGCVVKCSVGNKWRDWLYRHAVPHVYGPSSFFRRSLFEKAGGFDVTLEYCMDWDLWIKFMNVGARFERIPEYLWAQRQWNGSKTQRPLDSGEMTAHLAEVHRMAGKNGFSITRLGSLLTRFVRFLEGCYFKEFLDGRKYKGRNVMSIRV